MSRLMNGGLEPAGAIEPDAGGALEPPGAIVPDAGGADLNLLVP